MKSDVPRPGRKAGATHNERGDVLASSAEEITSRAFLASASAAPAYARTFPGGL